MQAFNNKKLDIIVVGGSLAGLMVSIPLIRLGHNVAILERSSSPLLHNQGAGIVAGGETQAFFARHDRTKRQIAVTSEQRLYLNKRGDVIHTEETVQRMTSWDLLYYLARANFDAVKSDYLPGGRVSSQDVGDGKATYEYGRLVTHVKELGDKVEVTFKDVRQSQDVVSKGLVSEHDTIQADFLIIADGPSSNMRKLLLPEGELRKYAGYVAFRGTVAESELSTDASSIFVEKFTFFHANGTQILAYTIPGSNGALEKGKRFVNWVWYSNYDNDSEEYKELMTDAEGNLHRFTLPTGGKMQSKVWEGIIEKAAETLPPQFAEIVTNTSMPFVQAITDLPPPVASFDQRKLLHGKAVIVGDAFSGFRPHTAASTSQAAYHALLLEQLFRGERTWEEFNEATLHFGQGWFERGVLLGTRSQFGHHPLDGGNVTTASMQVDRRRLWMQT